MPNCTHPVSTVAVESRRSKAYCMCIRVWGRRFLGSVFKRMRFIAEGYKIVHIEGCVRKCFLHELKTLVLCKMR